MLIVYSRSNFQLSKANSRFVSDILQLVALLSIDEMEDQWQEEEKMIMKDR